MLTMGKMGLSQALDRAVACHAQGHLREAERLYRRVLKADGRHFAAMHGLGVVCLQQRRFADAVSRLRRAIELDRTSAEAHHNLGFALIGLGSLEEAIRFLQKAIDLNGNFAAAYNNLGYALQRLGRTEQAVAQYERALAIAPAYPEARINLGNALQLLGSAEAAIAQYENALAIRPDDPEAHNNLAGALATLRRYEEAIAHCNKALASRPNYPEAHINLAVALGGLDRYEETIDPLEQALIVDPANVDARIMLGKALEALREFEDAAMQYDKALAIDPKHMEARLLRGDLLARIGCHEQAAAVLENLVDDGVRSLGVLEALAALPAPFISQQMQARIHEALENTAEGTDELRAFVRAAVLDKAGRHRDAWNCLVHANRIVFSAIDAEYARVEARQQANLARLRLRTAIGRPVVDVDFPISLFILGCSRSGKTSMETLVGTLPGVKRGYENFIVEKTIARACQHAEISEIKGLEDLPENLRPVCRKIYAAHLSQRAARVQVFTNTLPVRIHDVDVLAATLPNVRLLFVKRDPDDNVFRIFMRKYRRGNQYSYDLGAARDHVLWYHQMIDLLAEKLPEIVRVVRYEDVVAGPAAALRVAADLCGLPVTSIPLPSIGDDRGCATPYRDWMAAELAR